MDFALALASLLITALLAFGAFHRSEGNQRTRSARLLRYAAYSVQQGDDNVDVGYLVHEAAINRKNTGWNLVRISCGVLCACGIFVTVVLFVRSF